MNFPGDPQTLNRYSYVRNNPINMADPSGQCGLSLGFFVDPFGDYLGFLGGGGGNGGGGGGVGIYVGFGGFGGGRCGGDDRAGPQPPVYTPPQVGTDPNRSTDGFGCPYGSGSCGGIVFGYQDPGDLTWEVPTAWAILRALGPELVRLFWPITLAKGGASQNPLPSWVADRPRPGETADDFARRVCQAKYPPNGAGCGSGGGSEFNKIRKWAQDWINKQPKQAPKPTPKPQ